MNKGLKKYEIKIQALADKKHLFEFEGDSAFFATFEQEIVQEGSFNAKIELEKSATMLHLSIEIDGFVVLECDRSLEIFQEPIHISENYIYKFGSVARVIDEKMEVIPFGSTEINVAQHLFDYIMLAIPMKKIHPDYRTDDDDYTFVATIGSDNDDEEEDENTEIDPRWQALLDLKKK